MTTASPAAGARGTRSPAGPGAALARGVPVIVLSYPHSGTDRLWSLLADQAELACTSGSGVLPLCEQAAAAWANADGTADGRLSALAASSIRSLVATIVTSLLVQQGKRRWCEFATAPPRSAETFLRLYPQTRVLCLHRSCPDFICAVLLASPWGLASPAFAPFTSAYPASTVAALTAYWAAHTGALLEFEQAHPENCRRVRHDDLADGPGPGLHAFLGLEEAGADLMPAQASGPPPAIPVSQIPRPLLAVASDLTGKLGYPPLEAPPLEAPPLEAGQ
jgi:hypothetical protein